MSVDAARDEIIARACEDMLSMSETGREIFSSLSEKEQKTLKAKIKDIIKTLVDWVNELLGQYESRSDEARLLRAFEAELSEISKLWDQMLAKSIEANKALTAEGTTGEAIANAEKNTAETDGVKMSEKTFDEQVDDVLNGEDTISTHLRIAEHTPKLLLDLGLSDKPMLITSAHTKTALGYKVRGKNTHNVGVDVFKMLPQLIEKPAMIMESVKQGSIVMFVNAVDENSNPIMCSIKIDGRGFFNSVEIESNVVTSVYGKDTNPVGFVENAVKDNRLLYWNKKMSQKLFAIPGLQLPDNIKNFGSNVIIRKITEKSNEQIVNNEGVQFSERDDARITADMSDEERTEILSKKSIVAPIYEGQADSKIQENTDKFKSEQIGLVKKTIVAIAEHFGIIGADIRIEDVDVEITLSRSNLKESVSKKATPVELAKLLPILKESVSCAIGIERHDNRYYFDNDTVFFENLLGGYAENEYFVPVRFGLKHSKTGKATLYVVVDQNKIPLKELEQKKKTEVVNDTTSSRKKEMPSRSVEYSISQIIPFVKSKDLLRYIPDDMLDNEQKKAKWEAIAETIIYTNNKNDERYADFISEGNTTAAKGMVEEAARKNGYTIEAYHGGDHFFTVFGKGNKTSSAPDGAYFFTDNMDVAYSYTAYKNIVDLNVNNHPIYKQATPDGRIEENRVSHGGVYPVYLKLQNPYIVDFEGRHWGNKVNGMDINEIAVWAKENDYDGVIAKNIIDAGDMGDVNYEEGTTRVPSTDYIIFDSARAKSSETITYDDNGNVIPLSERFKQENEDIRYSERDYSYEALTSKPDMQLTVVGDNVSSNRADVIHLAKKNIAEIGTTDSKSGGLSVYVNDIDTNVIIGTDGLKHGLRRTTPGKTDANYVVTAKAGEIIKNSIKINDLTPSKESSESSYVLIGAAKTLKGDLYIVRSVINRFSNQLTSMDVLYAINAKKESAVLNAPRFADKPLSVTDSVISIAELLEYVNRYFPDILPESVLRHYGHTERPDGTLGESVLFSEKDYGTSAYDVLGESGALEKRLKALEADVIRLREMLHIEKHLTHGKVLDRKSVDAAARFLVKYGDSTYSSKELSEQLYDLYTDMRNTLLENPICRGMFSIQRL